MTGHFMLSMLKAVLLGVCTLHSVISVAEVSSETNYYSVVANNADELDAQLSINSRNGFYADTRWQIQPRYRFKESPSGCTVTDSSVELKITYSMPEWVNKSEASLELQEKWDNWYANLLSHEKNHGYNGRQAYNDIKQAIYFNNRAHTCAQLTRQLKEVVNEILFKYSQQDIFYDQRTKHGATEGANIRFSTMK